MTYEEMQIAWVDPEMIRLINSAMLEKAAAIVIEQGSGDERESFAKSALEDPNQASGGIWRFMVGNNASASLDAILRSVGDPSTPTDATIKTQVELAVDSMYPPTTP